MIVLGTGRAAERALAANATANFANLDDDHVVLRLEALAADGTFVVPAGYRLSSIDIVNTTANAVTGGINIGTTEGGDDILAAAAVGASATIHPTPLKRLFAAAQTVYISAETAWNSASLTVIVMLDQTTDV
jgi:hypothetical protein